MTATFALICALLAASQPISLDTIGAATSPVGGANVGAVGHPAVTRGSGPRPQWAWPETAKPSPALTLAGGTTYSGNLAWAAASHGPRYLALREPRGTLVEACGPAGCVTRRSTDFGPVLSLWRAGRIADLSAADWLKVCGVELRFGLCPGSIEILSRRPATALPATDEEGA